MEEIMDTIVRENCCNGMDSEQATERFIAPVATVLENEDGYALQVEMPGVNKKNLEISVENNELTIVGRRSLPSIAGRAIHRESRPENFRRTFEIDSSIDTAKISAKIERGVVTLTLPKAERMKPRKIAVS